MPERSQRQVPPPPPGGGTTPIPEPSDRQIPARPKRTPIQPSDGPARQVPSPSSLSPRGSTPQSSSSLRTSRSPRGRSDNSGISAQERLERRAARLRERLQPPTKQSDDKGPKPEPLANKGRKLEPGLAESTSDEAPERGPVREQPISRRAPKPPLAGTVPEPPQRRVAPAGSGARVPQPPERSQVEPPERRRPPSRILAALDAKLEAQELADRQAKAALRRSERPASRLRPALRATPPLRPFGAAPGGVDLPDPSLPPVPVIPLHGMGFEEPVVPIEDEQPNLLSSHFGGDDPLSDSYERLVKAAKRQAVLEDETVEPASEEAPISSEAEAHESEPESPAGQPTDVVVADGEGIGEPSRMVEGQASSIDSESDRLVEPTEAHDVPEVSPDPEVSLDEVGTLEAVSPGDDRAQEGELEVFTTKDDEPSGDISEPHEKTGGTDAQSSDLVDLDDAAPLIEESPSADQPSRTGEQTDIGVVPPISTVTVSSPEELEVVAPEVIHHLAPEAIAVDESPLHTPVDEAAIDSALASAVARTQPEPEQVEEVVDAPEPAKDDAPSSNRWFRALTGVLILLIFALVCVAAYRMMVKNGQVATSPTPTPIVPTTEAPVPSASASGPSKDAQASPLPALPPRAPLPSDAALPPPLPGSSDMPTVTTGAGSVEIGQRVVPLTQINEVNFTGLLGNSVAGEDVQIQSVLANGAHVWLGTDQDHRVLAIVPEPFRAALSNTQAGDRVDFVGNLAEADVPEILAPEQGRDRLIRQGAAILIRDISVRS